MDEARTIPVTDLHENDEAPAASLTSRDEKSRGWDWLLSTVPPEVARSFTEAQLAAVAHAFELHRSERHRDHRAGPLYGRSDREVRYQGDVLAVGGGQSWMRRGRFP